MRRVPGFVGEGQVGQGLVPGPGKQGLHLGLVQGFEDVDRGPRQQGRVHLEGRVLGGGADEGHQPGFHVGQEGILLGLVEAVDLIDEQQGAPPPGPVVLGPGDGLADFLDPGEHGGKSHEIGLHGAGHEPRQGGLAHPRRPPQDEGMGLAGGEGQAQGLALPQEVGLADHLVQGLGA